MEKGNQRGISIACLAVVCMSAAVLYQMGRQWWCSCGRLTVWSWDIWSSHNSQHLMDPYFFTHVLHGLVLFAILRQLLPGVTNELRFLFAVTVEACWEILENSPMIIERYRAVTVSQDYFGDSIANSMSDIIGCATGYALASYLRWWWTVVIFFLIEILLLATVRDNLTLNIIMLVYPVDAIKQWQVS